MQLHRYSFQYTIDALCKAGAWLAAFCLLVLALVVSYEVVVRYTTVCVQQLDSGVLGLLNDGRWLFGRSVCTSNEQSLRYYLFCR